MDYQVRNKLLIISYFYFLNNQRSETMTRINNFSQEEVNYNQIYLLKTCANRCIKNFDSYNLQKNESSCVKDCIIDYHKLSADE